MQIEKAILKDPPGGEALLHRAYGVLPYASLILDAEGTILAINSRAIKTFFPAGDAPKTVLGTKFFDLIEADEEEFLSALLRATASGKIEVTPRHTGSARKARPIAFRQILLFAAERTGYHYLLSQDQLHTTAKVLSQLNRQRQQARDTVQRLEAAHLDLNKSLLSMEAFAHAASHDLKTPINTMSGLLELFETNYAADLPDKAQTYLAQMQRAVSQMHDMTRDLLDYAKSTNHDVKAEPVDLSKVALQVLSDFETQRQETGAEFELHTSDLSLMAEPILLNILLSNIISNALKYRSPDRKPVIVVRIEADLLNKGQISISDNGIGFDPADAEKVFVQFQRLDTDRAGTGIGLATCAEICRRHGWQISATAEVDKGAEFVVKF